MNRPKWTGLGERRYSWRMVLRLWSMLVVLAAVLLIAVASGRAAGMSAGMDHASHADMMIHEVGDADGCTDRHGCDAMSAALCVYACSGILAVAVMPDEEAVLRPDHPRYRFPAAEAAEGRSPELPERPPKQRLL